MTAVTGTFGATGQSDDLQPVPTKSIPTRYSIWTEEGIPERYMNVSISGTFTATVTLERSFDGGSTYHTVATYTSATEARVAESEVGVLYRFNCTAYTSGTVTYRLSI